MDYLNRVIKIYLFFFGAYHLAAGIISLCFTDFSIPFNSFLYDFHPKMDPQLFLVAKPWGALSIFAGFASLFAFTNPLRYKGVIYSLIVLLLTRAGYRFIYAEQMHEVIKTQYCRNYINIGILILGASLLLYWSIKTIKLNK